MIKIISLLAILFVAVSLCLKIFFMFPLYSLLTVGVVALAVNRWNGDERELNRLLKSSGNTPTDKIRIKELMYTCELENANNKESVVDILCALKERKQYLTRLISSTVLPVGLEIERRPLYKRELRCIVNQISLCQNKMNEPLESWKKATT